MRGRAALLRSKAAWNRDSPARSASAIASSSPPASMRYSTRATRSCLARSRAAMRSSAAWKVNGGWASPGSRSPSPAAQRRCTTSSGARASRCSARGISRPFLNMNKNVLALDAAAEVGRITQSLRSQVLGQFRRRGAVLGISGGVDSSVVAALCARAFGADKVLGLLMPERDSSRDSLRLGRSIAESLGIQTLVEDVGPALEALGCYRRQAEAIRTLVPQYGEGWKCKLVLPSILERER